ncbi:MAG: 30S ribosomal protein S2 [Bacteroidetes bacterium]|nr:30S ribosomal protein S2 [Bacteroidota bacterium]
MPKTSFKELLDAGVHFGHLKRKWNPAMAPYIFMEKNGIHIIDLNKTEIKLNEASDAMKQIAKSGRKILFVATKKQAKDIVAEKVKTINMPYVTERWPGGMLTNFPTIRKAVKKMSAIDKMATDGTFENLSKRERLQIARQRAKLEKNLGSIADLTRLPAAMFIVDVHKEYIAVREANRLNIPVFAMVDTNSDPRDIDFPIPANDDASKSITLIIDFVCDTIAEGLSERKMEKEKEASETKAKADKKLEKNKEKFENKDEKTEAKGEAKGEHKPRTRTKPEKVEVKAEPKAEKAEPKEEPKAEKVEAKEEKKEEPKEEPKAEKVEAKEEAKEEVQPKDLSEAKNEEPKAEKAEVKEEAKAEAKEEVQPKDLSEAKNEEPKA